MELYSGKIIWFNSKDGFGFIEWFLNGKKQKDMFIHYSDLNMNGFKTINKDQEVTFKIGKNFKGQDKAIEVTAV
jgi:CspA family cold shock protein